MKDADLVTPEIKSRQGIFAVTLSHRSVFSLADQAGLGGYRSLRLSREEMLVARDLWRQRPVDPLRITEEAPESRPGRIMTRAPTAPGSGRPWPFT
jgi:hypothetical protein